MTTRISRSVDPWMVESFGAWPAMDYWWW